jgi:uncharacterized protein (DUF1778 family)
MENAEKPRAARHRIEIKLSEAQKNSIVKAASLAKQGVSEFVRRAAEAAANEIISRNRN